MSKRVDVSVVVVAGLAALGCGRSEEGAFDGYTLIAPYLSTSTYLIDMAGQIVHRWENDETPAGGAYLLEVCSPGVDRMLGREKDFARVVGRKVAVETKELLAGRRRFRGELLSFDGQEACVHTESGDYSIPFACIARAQAFYPFQAQGAKR